MKTLLTIFLSFCFSILLFAEDLVLKNGKIYHDYEVIRKDKKGIKIRYTVCDGTLRYSRTKAIPYHQPKTLGGITCGPYHAMGKRWRNSFGKLANTLL